MAMVVLVVLALLFAAVGLLLTSQVSIGSSIVAFAVLLAVLARINQASDHHKAMLAQLRAAQGSPARKPE